MGEIGIAAQSGTEVGLMEASVAAYAENEVGLGSGDTDGLRREAAAEPYDEKKEKGEVTFHGNKGV